MGVEEPRHEHLARGASSRSVVRTRRPGQVGADGGHPAVRDGHVPPHDLARVDVDDIGAEHEQVRRRRAEPDLDEAPASRGAGHAASPGGVMRSVQPRRDAQVRRNSA